QRGPNESSPVYHHGILVLPGFLPNPSDYGFERGLSAILLWQRPQRGSSGRGDQRLLHGDWYRSRLPPDGPQTPDLGPATRTRQRGFRQPALDAFAGPNARCRAGVNLARPGVRAAWHANGFLR